MQQYAKGNYTGSAMATATGLREPVNLEFDSAGNLFVANFRDSNVLEYKNGNLSTTPVTISNGIDADYYLALYNP